MRTFLLGLFRRLPPTIQLCSYYSAIVAEVYIVTSYTISVSNIRTSAKNYSICKMLLQVFECFRQDDDKKINIQQRSSALSIGAGGTRVLQLYMAPGLCLQTFLLNKINTYSLLRSTLFVPILKSQLATQSYTNLITLHDLHCFVHGFVGVTGLTIVTSTESNPRQHCRPESSALVIAKIQVHVNYATQASG